MTSSRALCCLPSVKKQIDDFQVCFVQCLITIIRFGFCDIHGQNNQGLGKGYQPKPNPYLGLDYSGNRERYPLHVRYALLKVLNNFSSTKA